MCEIGRTTRGILQDTPKAVPFALQQTLSSSSWHTARTYVPTSSQFEGEEGVMAVTSTCIACANL